MEAEEKESQNLSKEQQSDRLEGEENTNTEVKDIKPEGKGHRDGKTAYMIRPPIDPRI